MYSVLYFKKVKLFEKIKISKSLNIDYLNYLQIFYFRNFKKLKIKLIFKLLSNIEWIKTLNKLLKRILKKKLQKLYRSNIENIEKSNLITNKTKQPELSKNKPEKDLIKNLTKITK